MAGVVAKLGPKPLGVQRVHLHHVLSLNGRAGAEREFVREGQAILRKVGIDPVKGAENLAWAPNKGHTIMETKALVEALRGAQPGGYSRVVQILQRFGNRATKR